MPSPLAFTAHVASVRARLWDVELRPVALYSHDCEVVPSEHRGKRPKGNAWDERARRDPPEAALSTVEPDALGTGILCDGLRVPDIDVEDAAAVARLRALATAILGDTIVRSRSNSSRIALVYRAAVGEPLKRTLTGRLGKIEVLGRGQQLAAYGRHFTGADLHWEPEPPHEIGRHGLPAVTEVQVDAFLAAAAPIIGANQTDTRVATGAGILPHLPSVYGPSADPLDVAAALAAIPNDGPSDWEFWNKVGMATWAATSGSLAGFAAWVAWSERHPSYDPVLCRERWEHYPTSRPNSIGAGSLFHLAREARPGWVKPTSATQGATRTSSDDSVIDPARWRLDRLTVGNPPPRRFTLQPQMPLGTVGLLFGPGGVGKSMVALDLALTVGRRAVLNRRPSALPLTPGPLGAHVPAEAGGTAVFLTLEDDSAEIHRRVAALDPEHSRRDCPVFVVAGVELPSFAPELVEAQGRMARLTEFAKEGLDALLDRFAAEGDEPVRLLILDPAGDFLAGDENAAEFVKPLMRRLREVAWARGCTVLLLGHVAKGKTEDVPTMRGSGAWAANARFAYALWQPEWAEAGKVAKQIGADPANLVYGCLTKANHAHAPVNRRVTFVRQADGRLLDVTARLRGGAANDDAHLKALVAACAEAAAVGFPYSVQGEGGLYKGRADLPEPLRELPRARLEGLAETALSRGRLVKARGTKGNTTAPVYLDIPDGPLATGCPSERQAGSRQDASARARRAGGETTQEAG